MIARHFFLALATAALIAGCGGGADAPASLSAQKFAAAAQRADVHAAAVTSVQAAEQLFTTGEAAYPGFFPTASSSGTQSLSPFVYRYYSSTNTYLGVVVTAAPGYTLNGVYVVGPAFGNTLANPLYVGLMTDFVPGLVIDNGTPGGGTASACYDLSLADTQGTHIVIAYNYSGTIVGNENVDTTIGALVNFEGNSARETTIVTTGSHTAAGQTLAINTTGKAYTKRTGDAEVTDYGSVFDFSTVTAGFTFTTNIRTVMTPPAASHVYSLAAGASVTESQTGSTTSTIHTGFGPDQVSTATFTSTTTTKFVGQESVTVPAGTYNACKFETTTAGSSDVTTNWFIYGKGLHVKSVLTGSTPQTIEATSVKLNGAAQ